MNTWALIAKDYDIAEPHLLPLEKCVKTGPYDYYEWNYRFILGYIERWRFKLIKILLHEKHYHHILEIGYGSGIFLPELHEHCDELHGIDIHTKTNEVRDNLKQLGIDVTLHTLSGYSIPYEDHYFDCIVTVSTLEFVQNLDRFCSEIKRILHPDGIVAAVVPECNPLIDFGFKLLTGKTAEDDFHGGRQRVAMAIPNQFKILERKQFPPLSPRLLRLFSGYRLTHP